jgi:hypothetical protein
VNVEIVARSCEISRPTFRPVRALSLNLAECQNNRERMQRTSPTVSVDGAACNALNVLKGFSGLEHVVTVRVAFGAAWENHRRQVTPTHACSWSIHFDWFVR